MAINLGLSRVTRLLDALGNPESTFQALHVAGTNGKGSVCAYLGSVLTVAGMRPGKFTSPCLFTEDDAITIEGKRVPHVYEKARSLVDEVNRSHSIRATPFEVQTATAFTAFRDQGIKIAVIEVGMGGRTDATNVLKNVRCSGITKIGIDHEGFLGTTLREVASHKAGIMRPGVPCVVDSTNDAVVLERLQEESKKVGAPFYLTDGNIPENLRLLPGRFQRQNANVALQMLRLLDADLGAETIRQGFAQTRWPGRLEFLHPNLLVDGAHNISAAAELRSYVESIYGSSPIHWHFAFSKCPDAILPVLVRPQDIMSAHEFSPIPSMPWIKSTPVADIKKIASKLARNSDDPLPDVSRNPKTPQVVCGSLYLIGQYLPKSKVYTS